MKNLWRWVFLLVFGIAFVGCQEDMGIVNPTDPTTINKQPDMSNTTTGSCQLGNRIWKDLNKNGIQDINEKGFPGVTVCLYGSDGTWLYNCTVTNSNGNYNFKDLQTGSYKVRIEIPDGWTLSPMNVGNDFYDSDFDLNTDATKPFSESVELVADKSVFTLDGGLYPTSELGEIGNRIWKDLNKNGIQEAYEEGFAGITVCLYGSDGSWLYNCAQTDAEGNFLFQDVQAGNYKIRMNLPTGWTLSPLNMGNNDAIDSDFDISTDSTGRPYTHSITLNAGERNLLLDGGLYPINSIFGQVGDLVWNDLNRDGIRDVREPGIYGVKVELYTGSNNLFKIKEVVTDKNGAYHFDNLPAGRYIIKFIAPPGYRFTIKSQARMSGLDSDADPKTGFTQQINLGNGVIDLNLDAGLYTLRKRSNRLDMSIQN